VKAVVSQAKQKVACVSMELALAWFVNFVSDLCVLVMPESGEIISTD